MIEHQRQCEVQDKAWTADEIIQVVDATKTKVQSNSDLAWLWNTYSAVHAISHEIAMTQPLVGSIRPIPLSSHQPPTLFPPLHAP